jgi:hypothetical protein
MRTPVHSFRRTLLAAAFAGIPLMGIGTAAGAGTTGLATPAAAQSADPDRRILVSIDQRRLWLVDGEDTLFTAPVAVGKGGVFQFADKTYRFDTPRGQRRILAKLNDPSWIPPDWHYYEKAVRYGLEPVHLEDGARVELSDGTFIDVRESQVGRINRWGNWWPFTPGSEIIFDGKIFVPPLDSPQRRIPEALGPIKLSMGDGYLIHGTHVYNQESIGEAASHGCIRMRNDDVLHLSDLVSVGTPVVIF